MPLATMPRAPRSPMLWAAAAFAGGIAIGAHAWRPPMWWMVAWMACLLSCIFYLRRRVLPAFVLALGAVAVLGAVMMQAAVPATSSCSNATLPDSEAQITAHIMAEQSPFPEPSGEFRQRLDLQLDSISAGGIESPSCAGVRLSVYAIKQNEALFYGQRIIFRARLNAPRNFRNPGAFDYKAYLSEHGITALASVPRSGITVISGFAGSWLELVRVRARRSVLQKVDELWPPGDASLMDAMVAGEDAFISRSTRTDFQRSGTYHVLVVSGMNVTILAFVIFWALRWLLKSDAWAGIISFAIIVFYALLTEVGAPVWRATLMLGVYLVTRFFYRDKSMLNALGIAALWVLLFDPKLLFGASFQLTFLCVWLVAGIGIPILERTLQPYVRGTYLPHSLRYDLSLAPRVVQFRLDMRMIADRAGLLFGKAGTRISLRGLTTGLRFLLRGGELLIVSLILQAGLALPMAYYFHRVTTIGLPANLLVIPLTELLMPSTLLAVGISYISLFWARIPAAVAASALHGISGSVHWLGGLRAAELRVPTPTPAVILASALCLAFTMFAVSKRRLTVAAAFLLLIGCAAWIALAPVAPDIKPHVLEMTAIDVGQGDSVLLVTPQGKTILVDAGGLPYWAHSELNIGEDVVSPYLWSRAFRRLDVVAVSHAHADHIAGMPAVISNFHPSEVWVNGTAADELHQVLQAADHVGARVIERHKGERFEYGGAEIQVLAPAPGELAVRQNNLSLVFKISFGQSSALLEGDAEKREEEQITPELSAVDLLKVAHHGSATSTVPELLAAAHPRLAVISVGARNSYGHPRMEILQRLQAAGVHTFRTDMDGAVSFYLDGTSVTAHLPNLH
jgi:competence protein ComEC